MSRNDNDHFEPDQSLRKTGTEAAHLGRLISDILGPVSRGCDPRNGIWNESIDQGILSVFSSIFSKVEDYKSESIFSKMEDDRTENAC